MWKVSKSGELTMGSLSTSMISGSDVMRSICFAGSPAQRRVASLANFTGIALQACAEATEASDEAEEIDDARDERDDASETIDSGDELIDIVDAMLGATLGRRRQDHVSDMRVAISVWAACIAEHMLGRRAPLVALKTLAAGVLAQELAEVDCGVRLGVGRGPSRAGVGGRMSRRGSR